MHKLNLLVVFWSLCQFANSMSTDDQEIGAVKWATKFEIQIGNKFYHFETNKANWFQAANHCRELGGYLLNFESSEEMDAILPILPQGQIQFWTSAHCLSGNRKFISVTSGEPMPYMRWFPNEPNNLNNNEFCVELRINGGALNNIHCTNKWTG
ncbi:C-type lectin 37Db-like [Drosophila busckii]|uniref:C-type lectin 37Db-like n=1 Tax=Drosophila busckii TaxID=30019 RepID=UPI001432B2C5|nr:C-type lectin 37Db-like [Drosophila busckii]